MVIYSALKCSHVKLLIVVCELQLFILIASAQVPKALYHICPNTITYEPNSTYQANLRSLLYVISSNIAATNMFLNATEGDNAPDIIYGLVLCRGDISFDECRECLETATIEIVKICPKQKESYIWYDKCMLRYNNISFFGSLAFSPAQSLYTPFNVSNPVSFAQVLGEVMDVLINFASVNLKDVTPSCNIRYEIKKYPFYNGNPIVVSPAPPPSSPPGIGRLTTAVIVVIVVLITFSIILFTMCFYFRRQRARKKHNIMMEDTVVLSGKEFLEADSVQYDLRIIKAATNNFSANNKIGEGGFGEVFKGSLDNGQQIAVKRLSRGSGQGDQEFKNEVTIVAKLQHINLVRLLGYYLDKQERILIFEFVPNKSLDFMLFDQGKQQSLDWSRRYKIIGGVARGILYLHEDSRLRIIHRDIKAANVLLDNDMNAKISDFGLARIVGLDKSEGSTNQIVGTLGYMSPEYLVHGQFSVKSDVYSFGILVLEILSGRKNNKFYQSSEHLSSHAWNLWKNGKALELLDPALGDSFNEYDVTRCIHIGILCVQKDLVQRPTMASVVLMLNSSSMTPPIPHQPAFFIQDEVIRASNQAKIVSCSANEVSVSELYPR